MIPRTSTDYQNYSNSHRTTLDLLKKNLTLSWSRAVTYRKVSNVEIDCLFGKLGLSCLSEFIHLTRAEIAQINLAATVQFIVTILVRRPVFVKYQEVLQEFDLSYDHADVAHPCNRLR